MNNIVFTGVKRQSGRDEKHSLAFLILLSQAPVLTLHVMSLCTSQGFDGIGRILVFLGAKTISLLVPELLSPVGTSVLSSKGVWLQLDE